MYKIAICNSDYTDHGDNEDESYHTDYDIDPSDDQTTGLKRQTTQEFI